MQTTYENVLDHLQNLDSTNEIYVPSHESTVKFNTLSVKDQKNIISAAITTQSSNIEYNIALNDLILSKSKDNNILITDRLPIAIALRANSIDNVYTTDTQEQIPLEKLLETYPAIDTGVKYNSRVVEGDISILLRIPDLQTDNKFLIAINKQNKQQSPGAMIGEMYVYELAKYIESIQYRTTTQNVSGEPVSTVSSARFESLPAEDCVSLVELLPMKLNKHVVDFVAQTKRSDEMYSSYQNLRLPNDASLFALD